MRTEHEQDGWLSSATSGLVEQFREKLGDARQSRDITRRSTVRLSGWPSTT
jgi:hypothetical protein